MCYMYLSIFVTQITVMSVFIDFCVNNLMFLCRNILLLLVFRHENILSLDWLHRRKLFSYMQLDLDFQMLINFTYL